MLFRSPCNGCLWFVSQVQRLYRQARPAVNRTRYRSLRSQALSNRSLFEGIRVIAVARQIAAPFASYQLAMHGAEVITIDNPKETDR